MRSTTMVTVMFTDLVDSTALAVRMGPAGAEALRRDHFALLRKGIAPDGREVKNLGDGLMVVFPGPSAAMRAAVAVQQEVAAYNQRRRSGLEVRIGLALGEAVEEDGDVFGEPVVQAARLCALAAGGQILLTEFLLAGAGRGAGFDVNHLGPLALKGLPEPVPALEMVWSPAAETAFPLPTRLAGSGVFVGRGAELAELVAALKRAGEGSCPVTLVGGEPGIGKTTLATRFAQQAHDQGAIVLYGRCDEGLGLPYQPWAEAIAHLVAHLPSDGLDDCRAALDPLLHTTSLRSDPGSDDAPLWAIDPETARYLLFNAVVQALAAAGHIAPVVLVLDDLQWADVPSFQLLSFVVAAPEPLRLLVLGTFRESEVDATHPLSGLLSNLHRQGASARLSLRGLGDLELLEWMERTSGQEMDADGLTLRDALLAETDGNPFFAGELLRHLTETGAIFQTPSGRWEASPELRAQGLPLSVREVISRRVARLGPNVERVLAMAAVIGRDFDLATLAGAMASDPDEVVDLLEAAVRAGLVADLAAERYSFVHALIEHALYGSLSPTRAARAHRRVAEVIEALSAGDVGDRVGELARHWAAATTPSDVARAVDYSLQAGDRALAQLAPADAIRWYGQATELLGSGGSAALRARIAVGLGIAQRQSGDPRYRQTLLDAAHLALAEGDRDLVVAATLANTRGFFSALGEVDAARVSGLEAAIGVVGPAPSTERARLLALLAGELAYAFEHERRTALTAEATDMARQLGDPATVAAVYTASYFAVAVPSHLTELLANGDAAVAMAGRAGDPLLEFWTAALRCTAGESAGDGAGTDRLLERMVRINAHIRQPIQQWATSMGLGSIAAVRGDLSDAERLVEETFRLGTEYDQPDALPVYVIQIAMVRMMQGRGDEILELYSGLARTNFGIPRYIVARLHVEGGRPGEARQALGTDVVAALRALPYDVTWLPCLVNAAVPVAHLGIADAAAWIVERLAPFADQLEYNGATTNGAVGAALGRVAGVLDRHDDADRWFAEALRVADGDKSRWAAADARLAWGEALIPRGETDRARVHIRDALAVAEERGFGYIERTARRLLAT